MKIDWGSLIVEIVKKKDLDVYEFKDCWEENYNWTELDKFVIKEFEELLLKYGEVEAERLNLKVNIENDLNEYKKELIKCK